MRSLNMKPHHTKGLLITFCGLDGCGKTTMLNRLARDMEDLFPVLLTKQPTDSVRNSAIFRNYMDCANHQDYDYRSLSLLAASDRIQHVSKVIVPALERGEIVISDRYFYSCLANLRARGYEKDTWIYDVSKHIVRPDISFFFDVAPSKAIERVRRRPAEAHRFINVAFQEKLCREYRTICKENHGTMISTECRETETYQKVKNEVERTLRQWKNQIL